MNLFQLFHDRVTAVLAGIVAQGRLPADLDLSRFVVEPPRDPAHGDLAVNAALVYAKEAKAAGFGNPRQLAVEIAAALAEHQDVDQAELAGPGFINVRLRPDALHGVLRAALADSEAFARGTRPVGATVSIEYVSANPTGPMHVGHGRGAVFGDALARLLAFVGRRVIKEYYVNDAGAQVDKLARSAQARYREALGEPIDPASLEYPGEYLIPVGVALAEQHGAALRDQPETQWLPLVRDVAIAAMMDLISTDLAALGIRHDVFFSERSLIRGPEGDAVAAAISALREKGLVYVGHLAPPKGKPDDDWEDREQTLFRSTQFGDDVDRPLLKSDGGYTYFASDIAYHKVKMNRGASELIDVMGADHGGYVKRMQAAVRAFSDGQAMLDVKLVQLVQLMRGGVPVRMGKRLGNFVTLREVVDEVGVDAVRFMMLFRKNDAPLEFDLAKVIERSKDNAVFYVQYAYARTRAALAKARSVFPGLDTSAAALAKADLTMLTDAGEIALMREIAQFPRVIEGAAIAHEPHRLAFYLYDLSSTFHSHYTRGSKDQPQLRFVNEESREMTCARLALVSAIGGAIKTGLDILGVSAPDEM